MIGDTGGPSLDPYPAFSMVPWFPLLLGGCLWPSRLPLYPWVCQPRKTTPPVHLAPATRLLRVDGENFKSSLKVPPRNVFSKLGLSVIRWSFHSPYGLHTYSCPCSQALPAPQSSAPSLLLYKWACLYLLEKYLWSMVPAKLSSLFTYFLKCGLWGRFTWGVS